MANTLKKLAHSYMPSQVNNPFSLALRLLRTGGPEARFAMFSTLLGMVATPLDLLLSPLEARRYRKATARTEPIIFVCGPPRSGTTLLGQVLIRQLPVAYLNNLTSVFPRSPISANALLGPLIRRKPIDYRAYYGKSRYLSGPNDALYIWDRWFGKNRNEVPRTLLENSDQAMVEFFGAVESFYAKPLVTKNNRLNTCAHLVAEVLPRAHFLCLKRDPLFLAQSLLLARREIVGDMRHPYGIDSKTRVTSEDYIEDVCRQVMFYEAAAADQLARIGPERFWIVEYEKVCAAPEVLVRRAASEILSIDLEPTQLDELQPFAVSQKVRLPADEFESLQATLSRLRSTEEAQDAEPSAH